MAPVVLVAISLLCCSWITSKSQVALSFVIDLLSCYHCPWGDRFWDSILVRKWIQPKLCCMPSLLSSWLVVFGMGECCKYTLPVLWQCIFNVLSLRNVHPWRYCLSKVLVLWVYPGYPQTSPPCVCVSPENHQQLTASWHFGVYWIWCSVID